MKSLRLFTILFVSISFVEIFADLSGAVTWVYIFKPAIVLSLIALTWNTWKGSKSKGQFIFIAALIFALLGDIFLMFRGFDLFIPGLGSFLMMQLLYIYTFRNDARGSWLMRNAQMATIPFLLFALVLYTILFPNLPDPVMRVAVAIYALSIATMAWAAWLRKGLVPNSSFISVFLGAILFMISDSLIAIDRFLTSVPFNTIWVMGTYTAAQYLIVTGILKKQAGF